MRRLWAAAVSLRTSAILLAVIAALLLLSVLLPQASHDPAAFGAAVASGPAAKFVLLTLGLGRIAASPLFFATFALFMANLAAVLVDRSGATLRRVRFAPPTAPQLSAFDAVESAAEIDAQGVSEAVVQRVLVGSGYRTASLGEGRVWGVKHRLALLGFPAFHLSFFLLCLGALQLYGSREVVNVVAGEGQVVRASQGTVARRAPGGPMEDVALHLERVEVELEDGFPTGLGARVALDGAGPARWSRINHPATWGDVTVLVDRVGIAPVLWIVDARGYTRDRVVVATADPAGQATRVPLAGTGLEAEIDPIAIGKDFPVRSALRRTPVALRLRRGARAAFDGRLQAGQAVTVGDVSVQLEEVRYWVGLRLVRERGGGALIAGLVVAVAGIVWRMVWYRREVAVTRAAGRLRVAVRAEFYPSKARLEADSLARALSAHAERQEGGA